VLISIKKHKHFVSYNIYDATYEDNSYDIENQLQKTHMSRPFLFILNLLSLSITMMFFL
jgi:hypothetical protein